MTTENRFIQEFEALVTLLDETPTEGEREAILNFMDQVDTSTDELKVAAAKLISRAARTDPAIEALAIIRPESIMFTMMFALLVGYRAGRQCGE